MDLSSSGRIGYFIAKGVNASIAGFVYSFTFVRRL